MLRRKATWIGAAAGTAILLWATGCQNGLRVRVEKIEGVWSRVPDPSGEALATTHDALSGLDEICTECRLTYGDAAVEGTLSALADAQRGGRSLLPMVRDLMARQARGEIGGRALAARTSALHRRARELMPRVDLEMLRAFIAIDVDEERRDAMRRLADDLPVQMDQFAARLAAVVPGFGGLRQGGVYQINPGDPAYDRVLNGKAAANPISEVIIAATGDTGVMLVQESPAQMRLYQISNDPSAILRNASFILNKVLQAAVKFGSVE